MMAVCLMFCYKETHLEKNRIGDKITILHLVITNNDMYIL